MRSKRDPFQEKPRALAALPGAGWDSSRKEFLWLATGSSPSRSLFGAPVEEDVLLRGAVHEHTPIRPWMVVMVADPLGVIIVAGMFGDDAGVGLARKRTDYVGEFLFRQPGQAAVGGPARVHSVARDGFIALDARRGGFTLVIPHGLQRIICADREVRLPIRFGRAVQVQFHRRAKGDAIIRRADVVDVGRVSAGAVLVIDVVNHA